MKSTSIYIKSLNINNIRTFKNEVNLSFMREDGSLPQWTLILGDNGIGKSTLLQCVAWMKPYLPDDSGKGMIIPKEKIEPTINNEDNATLERLVSRGIDIETEIASLNGEFISGKKLNVMSKRKSVDTAYCTTKMDITLDADLKLKDVKHSFDTNNEAIFNSSEIFIFGYSASRVLGKTNIADQNVADSILGFLSDTTTLYDAEEILHTINYAVLGAKKAEKARYQGYLDNVKEALVSILPDFDSIKNIDIAPPKFIDGVIHQGELFITTKHGEKIPFKDFSLGYKTVVSWVVDLSWRLFNSFPESKKPFKEPAIVVVDEIDLHLHPIWQREIIRNLSAHFPNIQFIATAHSPLMVQAALKENYAVLKFVDDSVIIVNDPKSIDGWRVDQILTSEFFGLKTARGLEYEELLNKRQKLIRKKKLQKNEKSELEEVTRALANYPVGENEVEIENRKIISRVIEEIKAKKTVIEL